MDGFVAIIRTVCLPHDRLNALQMKFTLFYCGQQGYQVDPEKMIQHKDDISMGIGLTVFRMGGDMHNRLYK